MSEISKTLLVCISGEIMLLCIAIPRFRKKDWENSIQKFADYVGIFFGIPLFIFSIYAFLTQYN